MTIRDGVLEIRLEMCVWRRSEFVINCNIKDSVHKKFKVCSEKNINIDLVLFIRFLFLCDL